MSEKTKRPERELDMEGYFGGHSSSPYTRENGYRKVSDRPEIIFPDFPKSTYEPVQGAVIKGLQDNTSTSTDTGAGSASTGSSGTGTVKIDTSPVGAEFFLVDDSGKETSFGLTTTAITITDTPIGTYNYVIRLSGYNDYSSNITVVEGQICCISVDLQSSTESQKCTTQPVAPGTTGPTNVPVGTPGYIVLRERDFYAGAGIIVGLIVGAIVTYLLLKKK